MKKLAQTIEYIIENPDMWQSVQSNARRIIEEQFETKKDSGIIRAVII